MTAKPIALFAVAAWLSGATIAPGTEASIPPATTNVPAATATTPSSSNAKLASWSDDLNAALKQAEQAKKMVLVEVATDWDISAKKMDTDTFPDAGVQEQLKDAVLVRINPESSDAAKALAERMKASSYPTFLILNYKGSVVAMETGFQEPAKFAPFVGYFAKWFQENPLGPAPLDGMADDPLARARKAKPEDRDLPARSIDGDILLREEITVHKDCSFTLRERRASYMVHPERARSQDDISGTSRWFDASRQTAHCDFARIITPAGEAENLDLGKVVDKPYETAGDVSWSQHRLIIPSRAIRAGEILDTQVTIESQPRVPGHFETFYEVGTFRDLMGIRELVLHFPAELHLSKAAVRFDTPIKETKEADGTITWEISTTVAPNSDTLFLANPAEMWSGYYISTPWTWDALGTWYRSQVSGRDTLGPKAKEQVRQIKDETPDAAILPLKLRDWVHDHIRHYAINFLRSSFQPHQADETFNYRCGDDKDMALLLQAMLREAGVPATPVLLKPGYGGRLNADQPVVGDFDQCIVAVQSNGHDVFLDPLAETADDGWLPLADTNTQGLKIEDAKTEVVNLPPYHPREGDSILTEADLKEDGDATITAHYHFTGATAAYLKANFAKVSESRARDVFAALYRKQSANLTGFSMNDPRTKGGNLDITCITSDPHFAWPAGNGMRITLGSENPLIKNIAELLGGSRIAPFRFYPCDPTTVDFSVKLPQGTKVISKPTDLNLDTPFLKTTEIFSQTGDTIDWHTTFQTKDAVVPADQAEEVKSAYQTIEDNRGVTVLISLAHAAIPSPAPGLPTPEVAPARTPASLPGLD